MSRVGTPASLIDGGWRRRYGSLVALATFVCAMLASSVYATDAGSALTADAWRICEADDPSAEKLKRLEWLARGVALAERAIAAEPNSARAHFASFCNLAKQVELSGLSWRSLQRLQRLKQAIDTTLRLAPSDPDALVAKGELLRRLPRMLGGDESRAETYLRRALDHSPGHVAGRLFLARLLVEREAADALAEVTRAVEVAERAGSPADRAAARTLAASVDE
jgi:tetratricopeptide (TPR) repeat protein